MSAIDGRELAAETEFTVIAEESVDKEPRADTDKDEPQTGGNASIVLWLTLSIAAAGGMAGTMLYTKKSRHTR